ncbi:MAG: cupin domain-containing protein [Burkholderiales bacterium]|nr:cupin domain-containing protein [Burkholderiales bacterium]
MTILANADIVRQSLGGMVHQTLANADHGLERLSVWRQTIAPGGATPPHRHDCEEVVLIESGRGELVMGGAVRAFGPDSTLVIAPDAEHQIINTGDEPMRLVAVFSVTPVRVTAPDGTPIDLPWPT